MSLQTASILLVEDDESLQASLRDLLRDNGYQIHAAGTRHDGLVILKAIRPTVCLLDLNLPDGSGVDILKSIVHEGLSTKVIVTSAFPMIDLRKRFGQSIVVATLTKPVSPEQLLELVDKIIRT
jgi:DNA-binding NtrC family response regulator